MVCRKNGRGWQLIRVYYFITNEILRTHFVVRILEQNTSSSSGALKVCAHFFINLKKNKRFCTCSGAGGEHILLLTWRALD